MKITVNGEIKEIKEGTSVACLLQDIGLPAVGIAVELNREIVPRSRHGATSLKEGDALEIVKMVGGG